MSEELRIEAITLTAVAEAMENGDNDPTSYIEALHGVAHRIMELSNKAE